MEGSAVSASHLPDYCRENGLEIPLPEGTEILVDARLFVHLYHGNEPASPTCVRCPLWLRKQNANREKVFRGQFRRWTVPLKRRGQRGWVFGFAEDYENLAMLFKLAMGG